jgi:hypothetical protein
MAQTRNNMSEGFDGDDLPGLSPDDLEDDEDLAEVVDAAILMLSQLVPELHRLDAEILLQQQLLRDAFPEAWEQYLAVDEMVTARTSELAVELVRWAFNEGARHGYRRGEEP